jgi:hypothetical protein
MSGAFRLEGLSARALSSLRLGHQEGLHSGQRLSGYSKVNLGAITSPERVDRKGAFPLAFRWATKNPA